MRFPWKSLFVGLIVILLLATTGFLVWASTPLAPTSEALAALQSDSQVTIREQNGWWVFSPNSETPTTGFIFYPGGRVDARAYAPPLRAIAEQGFLTVIVPMPLNLAIFGINNAGDVISAFPQVNQWAIGGHSLGGAMSARFLQANPQRVAGIAFWGSFSDIDLSSLDIPAVTIYGTNDGVATGDLPNDGQQYAANYPQETAFVRIEGGNHSQFGWYGFQPGDGEASISHDEQQALIVQATVDMLRQTAP